MSGKGPLESSLAAVTNMSTHAHSQPTIGLVKGQESSIENAPDGNENFFDYHDVEEISEVVSGLISACEKMPKISGLTWEDKILACGFKSLPSCNSDSEEKEHYELVDNILRNNNLQRVKIPGDGNCLFSSCGYMLKNAKLSKEYTDFLLSLMVDPKAEMNELSNKLRQVVVQELRQNIERYKDFVNDMSHEKLMSEIQRLENSGTFAGDIGDFMLPAISNALQMNIDIVASSYDKPFQHVHANEAPLNPDPLCLVFITYGPGTEAPHVVICSLFSTVNRMKPLNSS